MTGMLASLVTLLLGLGIARWHKALARFHFAATPWMPTRRARAIADRECFVLGVVIAGGAMVCLVYSIVLAVLGAN